MPNIIEITDFHAPELDPYARRFRSLRTWLGTCLFL